jgi:hypothetical protein
MTLSDSPKLHFKELYHKLQKNGFNFYLEKCQSSSMTVSHHFLDKLKTIEKVLRLSSCFPRKLVEKYLVNQSSHESTYHSYYCLSHIIWKDNLSWQIVHQSLFPSEYFVKVIMSTMIINHHLINPPLIIPPDLIDSFSYIYCHYNKLLIIDALMHQGSIPHYENNDRFIFSEHAGALSMKNKIIDNIIVSANSFRQVLGDADIFLPNYSEQLLQYPYLFHTHPNAITYAGRINEGIVYEFPSANDIINFIKSYNEGNVQASFIVSPEGIYVIRPIYYQKKIHPGKDLLQLYYFLYHVTIYLEKKAMKFYQDILDKINPDIFHSQIGNNFSFIDKYNHFLEPFNVFIEYYPREKKNEEWCLRHFFLQYLE